MPCLGASATLPRVKLVPPSVGLFVGVFLALLGWQADAVTDSGLLLVGEQQREAVFLFVQFLGWGGGVGFGVTSLVGFFRAITSRDSLYAPYVEALAPVAAEYGRSVERHPRDGIGFASRAEGVRLEVLVQPAGKGFISVWMQVPSRQRLLFVPAAGGAASSDDVDWRLVGQRGNWMLRAEMPSVARPLLQEDGLVGDITALMRNREVRAVKHDQAGIEVLSDLVPAEDVRRVLKDILTACRRLRRTNG